LIAKIKLDGEVGETPNVSIGSASVDTWIAEQ
jgi:hypothetical protein